MLYGKFHGTNSYISRDVLIVPHFRSSQMIGSHAEVRAIPDGTAHYRLIPSALHACSVSESVFILIPEICL